MSFSTRFVYIGIGGTGLKIGKAFERLLREEVTGPDGRKLVDRGGTFTGLKPYELPGFIQTLYIDFVRAGPGLAPVGPPAPLAGGRAAHGDVREGARQRGPLVGRRHQPAARLEDREGRHGRLAAAQAQRVGQRADVRAAVHRRRPVPDHRAGRDVRVHGALRRRGAAARLPAADRAHRRLHRPARGVHGRGGDLAERRVPRRLLALGRHRRRPVPRRHAPDRPRGLVAARRDAVRDRAAGPAAERVRQRPRAVEAQERLAERDPGPGRPRPAHRRPERPDDRRRAAGPRVPGRLGGHRLAAGRAAGRHGEDGLPVPPPGGRAQRQRARRARRPVRDQPRPPALDLEPRVRPARLRADDDAARQAREQLGAAPGAPPHLRRPPPVRERRDRRGPRRARAARPPRVQAAPRDVPDRRAVRARRRDAGRGAWSCSRSAPASSRRCSPRSTAGSGPPSPSRSRPSPRTSARRCRRTRRRSGR